MSFRSKFRIPQSVLARTVGTETILFDLQSSSYYSLNQVGGRFWKLVQEGKDTDQILLLLVDEFDVDVQRLENDIRSLVCELQKLGLLEPTQGFV